MSGGKTATVNLNSNKLTVYETPSTSFAGSIVGTGGTLEKNGGGTLTLAGQNTYSGATIIKGGKIAVASGAILSASTASLTVGTAGALNTELILNSSQSVGSLDGTVGTGTSTITLNGAGTVLTISQTSAKTYAGLINGGGGIVKVGAAALTLSASSISYVGSTTVNAGTLFVNGQNYSGGAGIVGASATLAGGGRLTGNTTNNGTLAPGVTSGATGAFYLDGNYTQGSGGALAIDIGGTSTYDQLVVSGTATLAGTLQATLVGSFEPELGDNFTAMTFGSRSGSTDFGTYAGMDVGNYLELRPRFYATSLQLRTRPAQDGDINLDGTVDIFDINVVSAHWGESGPAGDANDDGTVDVFDTNFVSAHWGEGGGGGSAVAVPEASAIAIVLSASISYVGVAIMRRRWSASR